MALQLHINVSLNRHLDRTWRRLPGRPRNKWLDLISGDVLPTVDMVVQRRDGPRELDDDDDDKISTDTARSICVSTELLVLLVSKLTGGRLLCWRTVRCETLRQQEAARSQA